MFRWLKRWRRRRLIKYSSIRTTQWQDAFTALPLLARLSEPERARLKELVIVFLHEKQFMGAHDLHISTDMKLIIALQACLPILNLGLDWYEGWITIIVYPGGFAPRRMHTDESGLVHDYQESLSGESWQQGPLVLSWQDSDRSGELDGYNLVIHEFAHKLDMLNGHANGFPPLHRDMDPAHWSTVFTQAFADFEQRLQRGEDTGIDDYAATDPAEFFAVLSEVFFERPERIITHYPLVYDQLSAFYRQDPASAAW